MMLVFISKCCALRMYGIVYILGEEFECGADTIIHMIIVVLNDIIFIINK